MADERRAATTKIGGGADYAKVAERLRLFREDHANSKTESIYEYEVDKTVVFTVYLWKDKTDVIELMKSGVTDKELLRSSADANGTAKGEVGAKEKDFEKLESVATGRALAMLGYLASGEIASSEEMEAFEEYRAAQQQKAAEEIIGQIQTMTGNLELNKLLAANSAMLKNPAVVEAAKAKQAEFAKQKPAKPAEKPGAAVIGTDPKKPNTLKPASPGELTPSMRATNAGKPKGEQESLIND